MYSINHPKATLLIWLAKLIAIRLGHSDSVWRKEIPINDALALEAIWPVYPEVAYELSVPGSYTWKIGGKVIEGLREYVEFAYTSYSISGISPSDIEMIGVDQGLYQKVLSSEFRGL